MAGAEAETQVDQTFNHRVEKGEEQSVSFDIPLRSSFERAGNAVRRPVAIVTLITATLVSPSRSAEPIPRQIDPAYVDHLPDELDHALASVPRGVFLVASATYSFGTAIGPKGSVYFTSFAERTITRVLPDRFGRPSIFSEVPVVAKDKPGAYGIVAGTKDDLFYALDAGVGLGEVRHLLPDGSESTIMSVCGGRWLPVETTSMRHRLPISCSSSG
ncbi:hypothetical protein ACFL5Q_04170 [Planctomycetota bacterium]